MYIRLYQTWLDQRPTTQDLILRNIKADIARRLLSRAKMIEYESESATEAEDQDRYEAELEAELDNSYSKLDLLNGTRPQREGELRDPSAELAVPLSPDIEPAQEEN